MSTETYSTSWGFDLDCADMSLQKVSRVHSSATGLSKIVTDGRSSYFTQDVRDSLWQILNSLLLIFEKIKHHPEQEALIQVDGDVTRLLNQLERENDSSFILKGQPFIDYLEKVHTGLLTLVDHMIESGFSSEKIANFDTYANKVYAWHLRLSDLIDPEMQKLLRLAASIRVFK